MHWSSVGHCPRCTGTRGPNGWWGLPWEAAQPTDTKQGLTLTETEARTRSVGWCRGEAEPVGLCGSTAIPVRCDCTLNIPSDKLPALAVLPGSSAGMLLCTLQGPCMGTGGFFFQGKVWVHTPFTLNKVYKATVENPKQELQAGWGKIKLLHAWYHLWGKRGEMYANISCFFQGSARSAELEPVLIFIGVFFENHFWVSIVWDIADKI